MLLCHDQADATEGPDAKGARGRRRQVARRHGIDLKGRRRQDLARICRDGMEAFCLDVGLGAFAGAMQAEVEEICGPGGGGWRRYARYGAAPGSIAIGSRKVAIERPRVRELGESLTCAHRRGREQLPIAAEGSRLFRPPVRGPSTGPATDPR